MKKGLLFLTIVAVCVFGMQKQLQDVKERIQMLRAAGVPEDELADLKAQEAALEDQASSGASEDSFETRFARWKELSVRAHEDEVIEKSQLEYELLTDLAQQSKSRWFYTDDLINKALELKGTPIENKPPFGLTIQVPRDVRKDLSNPLVYLVSFQQIENTCGFHALANAYAITQQVTENRPITYEGTRELAQKTFQTKIESDPSFKQLVCPTIFNQPEYSDLLSVIKQLGFRSHFDPDPNFFLIDNTNIDEASVQPIQAQQIRFNPVTNFMYRTPGHFLIISVVHKEGNYTMFLLDSANSPVHVGGQGARFIAHIDNLIQMAKNIDISSGESADFESEQMRRQRELEEEKKKNEAAAKKRKHSQSESGTRDTSQSSDESAEETPDQAEMNRRIIRQFNELLGEDPGIMPYQEITDLWDGIRDKARTYLGTFGSDKKIVSIHLIAQGLGAVPTLEGKVAIQDDQNARNYYQKLRERAVKNAHAFIEQEKYTRALELLRPFTPDTSVEIIKTYIKMINHLAKQSKRSARDQAAEAIEYAKTLEREFNFFGGVTPAFTQEKAALEKLYNDLK